MYDLSTKRVDQIIETVAPISMDDLQKGFTDKELGFVVNYDNSTALRGVKFLTYLANMDVPSDVIVGSATPKEERFELIREYMSMTNLVGAQSLAITVASILTAFKGINEYFAEVENPILTAPEIVEFIEQNALLVNKWALFVDSLIIYTLSVNIKYGEAFGNPKDHYVNVDDARFVGANFVNLFELNSFMEQYFSEPGDEFFYFTKQFDPDNHMFGGKNLFYYFMTPQNPLPVIVEMMGTEAYTIEDLNKGADQLVELIEKRVA